ncbi:prepilin peptidase [Eisenbergiella sp.]
MLSCLLIFILGACFFYLINGFIISFSQKITLRKGFQRIFVYNDKHREHASGIKKIYVLNALFGGILCVCVSSFYGYWYSSLIVCVFLALLTVVSAVDYTTMEIPNIFVLAAFVLGIFSVYTMPGISLISRVLGIFVVSVPLFLLTLLIPGAFGGGDIKLMAACGLFLGIKLTLISFAFAVLTGGVYGSWLLVMKKKNGKEHFAFGPFLCLGMAAALFIGDKVWNWYAGLLYL